MFLIVGLGNPDKKYEKTRHNAGFLAVDFLAGKNVWQENKKLKSLISFCHSGLDQESRKLDPDFRRDDTDDLILAKPQTYMNNSGQAVTALMKKYNITNENLIIIYDELDLPFEIIRVKLGGSSAGHNGIKSIIENLGTENFWRLRIGISNEKKELIPADKFVLSKFSKEELEILNEKILPEVEKKVENVIKAD
ncbi:MAG TPA: aminoacyl-tRNA hydrolase [bacterium]|nr:aminoacyl-tRNA hydrolase [bacterium]